MKRLVTAVLVSALAFPAGALAVTGPVAPQVPPRVNAPGTDVAAPDQQSPLPPRVNAPGTDVAAPDQQSSPVYETDLAPTPSGGDFDWGDAGIGAVGAICLTAFALGSGVTLRRRVRRTAMVAG